MSDELKPCPFCGVATDFIDVNTGEIVPACKNIRCLVIASALTVEAWNTRPLEDALQARIDELEHKNEVLMDSYLESETIDDKGKLVGSLEHFRQRIADLESENKALRLSAGSHSMSELRRNRTMAGIEQFIEKYREVSGRK